MPLKARTPSRVSPITAPLLVSTSGGDMESGADGRGCAVMFDHIRTLLAEILDADRMGLMRGRRRCRRDHAAAGDEDGDRNPPRRALAEQALADHRREAGSKETELGADRGPRIAHPRLEHLGVERRPDRV